MECFSLNRYLIPALRSNRIRYLYVNSVIDPMKIVVRYEDADICRVEAIQDLCTPYCYKVTWVDPMDIIHFPIKYKHYTELIYDIKKAIRRLENGGENNMNKKMYRVSDIGFRSSPGQMDEITFTVNVLGSYPAVREDCDRIREAIESISDINDTNELCYAVYRGNGKTYNWRNEYQKERDKFDIKDVIFNDPATIVLWADGTKTVVKAENEPFDPEKGLAMAISKRALGGKYDYYDTFKKYVGKYEKKQKKGSK